MPQTISTLIEDKQILNETSELLRALAHPLRIQILNFICKNNEINVNRIYGSLDLEQSITSQHLKVLRDSHIVLHQKKGKYVLYTVNIDKLKKLELALDKLLSN